MPQDAHFVFFVWSTLAFTQEKGLKVLHSMEALGACVIKYYSFVMYRKLRVYVTSKHFFRIVSHFHQPERTHQLTTEAVPYKQVMFYITGPWSYLLISDQLENISRTRLFFKSFGDKRKSFITFATCSTASTIKLTASSSTPETQKS